MGSVRAAENLVTTIGDPFPPLPDALVSPGETSEGPAFWEQVLEST
jgi:hypothetical protein